MVSNTAFLDEKPIRRGNFHMSVNQRFPIIVKNLRFLRLRMEISSALNFQPCWNFNNLNNIGKIL
ncbi:hypothetical protein CMO83_01445 [Candidatus Woesearchaeota archaeon]|nr:hypothetical protein [Candidatus Woesearchaeota archaeon]